MNVPTGALLTMDAAVVHCTEGIGIWQWASNDRETEPDVVMACCGDTPTLEIIAAVSILWEHLPELKKSYRQHAWHFGIDQRHDPLR